MIFDYKKGFTLIEILIVLAILILIVAIVLPRFADIRETQALKNASEISIATLDKARSQSISSLDSSTYGVHFEESKMVLFKGSSYSSSDPDNVDVPLLAPAYISDISLTDDAEDVVFDRLKGLPDVAGSITISTSSKNQNINISSSGSFSLE